MDPISVTHTIFKREIIDRVYINETALSLIGFKVRLDQTDGGVNYGVCMYVWLWSKLWGKYVCMYVWLWSKLWGKYVCMYGCGVNYGVSMYV